MCNVSPSLKRSACVDPKLFSVSLEIFTLEQSFSEWAAFSAEILSSVISGHQCYCIWEIQNKTS